MAPDTGGSSSLFAASRRNSYGKWDMLFDDDAKEWIAFKPVLGLQAYACYSCKHIFYTKKSFLDHVNRRTMVLTYTCAECNNNRLSFYNRCSFLLHCRKHFGVTTGQVNLKNLEISSLPFGWAGFTRLPDVPYLFDVVEEPIDGDQFTNSQFYVPQSEDKGKDIVSFTPGNLIINRRTPEGQTEALSLKQIAKDIPKCEFVSLVELQTGTRTLSEAVELPVVIKTEPADSPPHQHNSEPSVGSGSSSDQDVSRQDPELTLTEQLNDTSASGDNVVIMPVITKIETVEECNSSGNAKCPECKTPLNDNPSIHFLGENRPKSEEYRCVHCNLICPTGCSFKAHARIHTKAAPFVCPDCGIEFPQVALLGKHMDEVCYHLAKSVRFRCPGKRCGKIFASAATFGPHFKQVHIENKYTCGVCSLIFPQLEDCEQHVLTHEEEAAAISKVFTCSTCESADMNWQELKKHMDYHCKDLSRCIYIFMCKYCKCYFRSVQTMATHLQNCKVQKSGLPRRSRACGNFIPSKYATGQCKACQVKTIYLKAKPTSYCTKCLPKPKTNTVLVPEKCVCILCKTQIEFNERRRHQMECKYAKPQVLVEKLHLDQDSVINQSSSSGNSDLDGSPQKRGDSGDENRPAKKRHKPNAKLKKADADSDPTAEEPTQFNGVYLCHICGFRNPDRETFHKHVKRHRHIATAYQCMECGECFVVKPSLIKHLMHFHGISKHEQYFSKNDCFDSNAVKALNKVVKNPYLANNVKENQCKVCLEQFDGREAHDKHFRTHGMAFLLKNTV